MSQCRKIERSDLLGFFNIHSVAKHQKVEGGPFGENFSKKSHNAEKNKGGPFSISRYGMLRGRKKRKNLFGSVR